MENHDKVTELVYKKQKQLPESDFSQSYKK